MSNNKKMSGGELSAYKIQWLAVRVRGGRGLTKHDRESIGRYCGAGKWFGPTLVDGFPAASAFDGLWVMHLTARHRWTPDDVRRELCHKRPRLLSRGKEFAFYVFTDAQWGRGYGLTAAQIEAGVSYSTAGGGKKGVKNGC